MSNKKLVDLFGAFSRPWPFNGYCIHWSFWRPPSFCGHKIPLLYFIKTGVLCVNTRVFLFEKVELWVNFINETRLPPSPQKTSHSFIFAVNVDEFFLGWRVREMAQVLVSRREGSFRVPSPCRSKQFKQILLHKVGFECPHHLMVSTPLNLHS